MTTRGKNEGRTAVLSPRGHLSFEQRRSPHAGISSAEHHAFTLPTWQPSACSTQHLANWHRQRARPCQLHPRPWGYLSVPEWRGSSGGLPLSGLGAGSGNSSAIVHQLVFGDTAGRESQCNLKTPEGNVSRHSKQDDMADSCCAVKVLSYSGTFVFIKWTLIFSLCMFNVFLANVP